MNATHEVFNQPAPLADVNLFAGNRPLRAALAVLMPALDTTSLHAAGAEFGSAALQQHARLANTHTPVLHTHSRAGHRIDEVEFHPSYHALLGTALRHGLHGAPWAAGPGEHVRRAAAFMMFTEAEPGILCPVSMSYAVTPALRGHPALYGAAGADLGAKLANKAYDERFVPIAQKATLTMGMGMTEKQGGSDVRANSTRAVFEGVDGWGRRYALTGHKWFFSAPMCDAFLVLAQTDAGLSCFFLPRWRLDGARNAIHIQRLKDKLGNRANASSEVEFQGAQAWLVGDEGRGVMQILQMGALTRLDCALGTAGLMRQALSLALNHCSQRKAFGKTLIEQPLMQNVLADLALDSEAATVLALRLAVAVDGSEHSPNPQDRAHESTMRRLLTPVAKFWVCKRGSHFAQEAMECLGGNGYVEEGGQGVMARIYREMPLNSIWEGAGNIMALDLLRAFRGKEGGADVAPALEREFAAARGAHAAFDALASSVLQRADGVTEEAEARSLARSLARDTALVLQAALLRRTAPGFVFNAFCDTRLARASDVYGLVPPHHDLRSLMERAMPQKSNTETA